MYYKRWKNLSTLLISFPATVTHSHRKQKQSTMCEESSFCQYNWGSCQCWLFFSLIFTMVNYQLSIIFISDIFLFSVTFLQGVSLVAQTVKNLPAMWGTWVWSLGWEDPLEECMATHSSILAWKIPMDRGPW